MPKIKDAREELTRVLSSEGILALLADSPEKVVQYMTNWYEAYKEFEAGDEDFNKIWRAHRMLMRSIGATDTSYASLQVKPLNYKAWKEKGWEAAAEKVDQISIPGVAYNTGKDGIVKRTNPENFIRPPEDTGAIKKKYSEGLLDVSGTLLRNDREISRQLHEKPKGGDWACFLPLSEEEDQELLLFLKDKLGQLQAILGKGHTGLNLVINKYKRICAEVTRIKLAFETDMALGFVGIPNEDGTYSKYKYMVKSEVKYSMNRVGELKNKKLFINDDLAKLLRNNVKRYKSVVGIAIKNEVRIAIRKHANPKWPVFAKFEGDGENHIGKWEVYSQGKEGWVKTKETIPNLLPA